MVELWFKELGFYNNPFSIKPAAYNTEVFGYNLDDIFTKIDSGSISLILGKYGMGKTAILKRLIAKYGGQKRLIYYSCNRTEENIDFDKLLKERNGFIGKLFNIMPNNVILLLDEAQDMSETDSEKLLTYYPKNLKSVVLVTSDKDELKFSNGLKEMVKDNITELKEITEDDAISLIRKRIGNLETLPDDMVKLIFKRSNKNPRRLLKNCELVCKYAVENGEDVVTEEHVKKVLKEV